MVGFSETPFVGAFESRFHPKSYMTRRGEGDRSFRMAESIYMVLFKIIERSHLISLSYRESAQ